MAKRVGTIERPKRPRELQDGLNYHLYHPLAWRLARALAHTPLTPNMVSVFGGLLVVAAGVVYFNMDATGGTWALGWPWGALLGLVLHMSWHVVDGADGDLARITGKTSPIGEMVDGICDYLSHIVLYVLLAFVLTRQIGAGAAWAWTLAAGASHIVQSNHVEVQRRFYQYWTYGVPWLNNAKDNGAGLFGSGGLFARLFEPIARAYLRLAAGMTPHARQIDAAVGAAMASGDDGRLAAIRAEVAREQKPLLDFLKLLGPNPRAIVLGLAMLAGSPVWYFFYQAVVLNVLLIISVQLHNRAAMATASRLDGPPPPGSPAFS
ncbi:MULTISPECIES: CDP-alcohol phosphatidyltransferase family protein [unclassified Novosphingobium]|uniref:CDP-alcohol phosphatidyltransferase family protein n=1 Tax=unclassified Novosphingobium TaxID=2644732 RepID=UPI0025EC1B1B|nr:MULTISPECIES: CDP-alcohol phosphatidyltransferase family protein [unclassified Novosphingobium]HQS69467.1 CDP-alcohol phosphatidyltransferase family protein [Novosphingobium sp.]